jgi:hypothetical protein
VDEPELYPVWWTEEVGFGSSGVFCTTYIILLWRILMLFTALCFNTDLG